jgi:hypothetical protein
VGILISMVPVSQTPQKCDYSKYKITTMMSFYGWTMGVLRFDSRRGLGIFLFTTTSGTDLGPTQPPIQWLPGALSLGVKRAGREADHSPPSSAEVKEWVELYSTPQYAFMAWCLVKHRDNFTFTFAFTWSIAPRSLDLGTRRRWVVSFTPQG